VVVDAKMFPQKQSSEASKWKSSRVIGDVRIVFVQFADGSAWGDLKEAQQYLEQRQRAWKELQLLATLYQRNEEQQFVASLTKSSALGPYLGKLKVLYSQTKAVEPVAQEMENFLRLGNLHLRNMRNRMLQPVSRNSDTSPKQ
jgi:hypothetical protein